METCLCLRHLFVSTISIVFNIFDKRVLGRLLLFLQFDWNYHDIHDLSLTYMLNISLVIIFYCHCVNAPVSVITKRIILTSIVMIIFNWFYYYYNDYHYTYSFCMIYNIFPIMFFSYVVAACMIIIRFFICCCYCLPFSLQLSQSRYYINRNISRWSAALSIPLLIFYFLFFFNMICLSTYYFRLSTSARCKKVTFPPQKLNKKQSGNSTRVSNRAPSTINSLGREGNEHTWGIFFVYGESPNFLSTWSSADLWWENVFSFLLPFASVKERIRNTKAKREWTKEKQKFSFFCFHYSSLCFYRWF